jgi:ubiquinone/menaquinone biosynthesis C-methylase UbiE
MNSIDIATDARAVKHDSEWVRAVRTESPPRSMDDYLRSWEAFFDYYATQSDYWHHRNAGYHRAIASLTKFYTVPGAAVLEVGSGNGDLLAALKPSHGVGIDISGEMVRLASSKYPSIKFRQVSGERLDLPEQKFDFIILSDLVGYLYDIRLVFERLRSVCHSRTRLIVNWYSRLWQPILALAEKVRLKYPQPLINWTTAEDIGNVLNLTEFEVVHQRGHILMPTQTPVLASLANRYLAHLPGLRWLCLTNWIVARPVEPEPVGPAPQVSVICPCRNEAGNIREVVERLPRMGSHTELILVEGHSQDDTLEQCRRVATASDKDIKTLTQNGRGKGDAVRLGFSQASGDILMILDADLSVAPEDLPQFYNALVSGKGEFINGSRLVYAKDPKAMRFLNLLGNKFFALLLTRLLGQAVKDTLCGTKVLYRSDYERIAGGRGYFGDLDPFGDFDLLFGAAKQNLKIVEIPIRYRQRTYGTTNISRFTHGWLLIQMSFRAARKLLFID